MRPIGSRGQVPSGEVPGLCLSAGLHSPLQSTPTLLMAQPRGDHCQPVGHTQVSEMKAHYPRFRQLRRSWGSSPAHSSSSHRLLQCREKQSEEGSVGANSRGCLWGKNGGPTIDCPLWDCCPGARPLHASAPTASYRGKELIAWLLTPGWTDSRSLWNSYIFPSVQSNQHTLLLKWYFWSWARGQVLPTMHLIAKKRLLGKSQVLLEACLGLCQKYRKLL